MLIVIPIWLLADFACKDITINWSDKQKQRTRNAAALTGWKHRAKVCAHVRRAACQSTSNMKHKTKNNEQKENYIFFLHACTRYENTRHKPPNGRTPPKRQTSTATSSPIQRPNRVILRAFLSTFKSPFGHKRQTNGHKKGIPLNPNLLLTLNLIPWKTHCKVRHLFYNLQVFGRLFLKNVSLLT